MSTEQNKPATVPASVAMLRVLESWGVKHIYGYPGGSFNSTMAALDAEKEHIQFIHVRHEQVAALAASADAKLTGHVQVCFGSAGPGATNLLTGLYDAREDHAPVVALIGQVPSTNMNYDYFQEFAENPMFEDVAVYDRTVMTPESLPYVVDKAVREAYKHKGVAVVVIPNNFGYVQIPDTPYSSSSPTDRKPAPLPHATDEEVREVVRLIKEAKRPVIHVGRGIGAGGEKLVELSKKLQVPLVLTGLAKGLVPDEYEANLGYANRAACKAADEAFATADLVIALGSNFPFANLVYRTHEFKFVQIDADAGRFGSHHFLDYGVWSDATSFVESALRLLETGEVEETESTPFFRACVAANQNWREYLQKMMNRESDPLEFEAVYKQINRVAEEDALFSIDVGDNIINSFRYLNLTPKNKWTISALFASMGYGLPGAIAGALSFPERQIFHIAGDGAYSMVMQDLITEKKYGLPVINVITSNASLNFIKSEQDDIAMPQHSGIFLEDQDFAMIAQGMGVEAVTVRSSAELPAAFDKAVEVTKAGRPFLIDAKITDKRGLPVEELEFHMEDGKLVETINANYNANGTLHHPETLEEFFASYDGEELLPMTHYFELEGVEI
ncbi:pyruvate oxidase [Alloscardovia macacae]|uniref:Pyruvate oxidase n=1 Tax=Alloscardovia macacae TaxID=1160091 RepID=A0A1Y2SSX5_9BIFI|nr:pyruvate oxidase [Alloscardovia macacae]OTA25411.1 pyruvate oxidase [Alloscardovia macacae]OTA27994.1 pyruvate oxidase [Alloscardovia macacae]